MKVSNTMNVIASFVVQKIPDLSLAYGGDTINYTIAIINTGDIALSINKNTGVLDPMLTDLTYDSGDNNNDSVLDVNEIWYYSGTYLLPILAANLDPDYVEEHSDGDHYDTVLVNTVTVTALAGATTLTEFDTAEVKLAPDFTLVKLNDPAENVPVRPGDEIEYTLLLTNTGIGTGSEIRIEDLIPEHTTYVSDSATITADPADPVVPVRTLEILPPLGNNDPLVFLVNYLKAGETVTITFKVTVDEEPEPGADTIENFATMTAAGVIPVESNIVYNALQVRALLKITKVVQYDVDSGYDPNNIADSGTKFTIRIESADSGFATDLILTAGTTVELEVPLGSYTISEVAVPMEYSLLSIILNSINNGETVATETVTVSSSISHVISTEEVQVTFTNKFEHVTYFHSTDGVKNTFGPQE
jgi:uncharacterized repeat protein (TIGR01451 family)